MSPDNGSSFKILYASLRAVGTMATMASAGVLLKRMGLMTPQISRGLSEISMKLTIPCLLFTTAIDCTQDWSSVPCTRLADQLKEGWPMLLLPALYVGLGVLVGMGAALVGGAQEDFRRSAIAAVTFGNSTGLPITLLAVVHAQFAKDTNLGGTNPLLFLSVYLVLYPVLQWTVGSWLLSPRPKADPAADTPDVPGRSESFTQRLRSDTFEVLAKRRISVERVAAQGLELTRLQHDASSTFTSELGSSPSNRCVEMTERLSTSFLASQEAQDVENAGSRAVSEPGASDAAVVGDRVVVQDKKGELPGVLRFCGPTKFAAGQWAGVELDTPVGKNDGSVNGVSYFESPPNCGIFVRPLQIKKVTATGALLPNPQQEASTHAEPSHLSPSPSRIPSIPSPAASMSWTTISTVLVRVFPPPVVAALSGMIIALIPPVRGMLIDTEDRNGDAWLQWVFNGMQKVGKAAVPINMFILGNSLAKGMGQAVSLRTASAVAFAKMVVMPTIGLLVGWAMSTAEIMSEGPNSSFYLVVMIVTATPTANNLIVMAELAGENKEGLATCIFLEYALSPILLTLWLSIYISVANSHEGH